MDTLYVNTCTKLFHVIYYKIEPELDPFSFAFLILMVADLDQTNWGYNHKHFLVLQM